MPDLKKMVHERLQTAVDNGYYAELIAMTPRELAYDLVDYAGDLNDLIPEGSDACTWADENLVYLAKEWLDERKKES